MQTVTFILALIGTITGCLALYINFLKYQRDCAKDELDTIRDERESQPIFKFMGGGANHASLIKRLDVYREFKNVGAPVTDLSVTTTVAEMNSAIVPKNHVGTNDTARIEFSKSDVNTLPDFSFEIHYTTRLNKITKKCFFWAMNSEPIELK